ncbi:MAG: SsrA-binding protein SmpB [Phycisphaerae bacterium]|nr:SsrA-binding protein SmpB [Phycisphaerae bacterium]
MAKGPSQTPKIVNKKVRYNFEVLETLEAGISLTGSEVKSLRAGKASLDEAYAFLKEGELFLVGCNISPYPMAGYAQHKPTRERKLLLHLRQIRKWAAKVSQRGLTIVPLSLYFNERGLVKISLALARGKTHADKRVELKKRQYQRDMDQALRRRR